MFHVAFVSQISVWGLLISFCGIISVIWATFAGLYQKRIKRLMAYSAIGHVGFISLGLGCCTVYSVQSVSAYIGLYIFMSLAGFLALLLVNIVQAKYLINWSSLSETNSFLSLTFAIVLLATAGIPPLAGFITKLLVLFALIEQSFIALSILLVIFSCISCFYYIRLIKLMFFSKPLNSRLWVACNDRNAETLYLAVILLVTLVLVRPDVVFLSTSLVALAIV
jgi:NADH-quinone oxidoreductase subunit N